MQYTIEDTFDVSAAHYWDVFFSEAYNQALWPALDIDWQPLVFERTGEGDTLVIVREARITPRREVPRVLRSLVSASVSYVERNEFLAATGRMDTRITPSFLADRIDNHGSYRLETIGSRKVKRIWEGACTARIPLLGGRVEEFLVEEVRESYRKTTAFTRDWFVAHPEPA